jgi:hypothetical protein
VESSLTGARPGFPDLELSDAQVIERVRAGDGFCFEILVEQMSGAETAACLGIPEETVKTRLHRARLRLKDIVMSARDGRPRRRARLRLSLSNNRTDLLGRPSWSGPVARNPLRSRSLRACLPPARPGNRSFALA